MSDIRPSNWNQLDEILFQNSWNERLNRFRSNYVFRGVVDASWDLKTSLMRLGGDYARLEKPMLRNFRKYAHRDTCPGESVWSWLAVAQHHGLPTRLLDWTFSPYVAMHFATDDVERMNVDGAIWCVDFVETIKYLPDQLQAILEAEWGVGFTVEMLSKVAERLDEFDGLSPSDFVVFFEPPSLDDRVINQYALFSVMSNPETCLGEWLGQHPELYHRVIIPASMKWEVRDKLDQANINERMLFPGLDGLTGWLKRHYSPGPKAEQKKGAGAGQ